MECNHDEARSNNVDVEGEISWKYFLRQLHICSGIWTIYFMWGMVFGAPTVFIPQIRREANSTQAISDEMASWLMSVFGYSGIPGGILLPILTALIGRKISIIIVAINMLVAFIVFYCSTNPIHILISEIMQGLASACSVTVAIIIIAEYTSPRYRGFFSGIKGASFYWGIWVSNVIGTFSYWKNIAIFGLICATYTMTMFFWPESPQWLASKGRFEECAKSHRWLKGTSRYSEKELEKLIDSQKEFLVNRKNKEISIRQRMDEIIVTIKTKAFYKPLLLSSLINALYHLSGKLVCSMYAIDIIKRITNNESTAYMGMLILDGVTIFGMYFGCILVRYLRRRVMVLFFSTCGVLFLFAISLYLFLIKLSFFHENKIVSLMLLMGFSLTISCGPMILSTAIYSELMPLRYKSTCMILTGCFTQALMASLLKVSPFIFKTLGMHGTFFLYGVCASVCIITLYKYLPETKDKTLQEIEEYFQDDKRGEAFSEEDKELMHLNTNSLILKTDYRPDKDCT